MPKWNAWEITIVFKNSLGGETIIKHDFRYLPMAVGYLAGYVAAHTDDDIFIRATVMPTNAVLTEDDVETNRELPEITD